MRNEIDLIAEKTYIDRFPSTVTAPWENVDVESFGGKLHDELLNRELFAPLWEVQVLMEHWRGHYNQVRPHRALGLRPPAPETIAP